MFPQMDKEQAEDEVVSANLNRKRKAPLARLTAKAQQIKQEKERPPDPSKIFQGYKPPKRKQKTKHKPVVDEPHKKMPVNCDP